MWWTNTPVDCCVTMDTTEDCTLVRQDVGGAVSPEDDAGQHVPILLAAEQAPKRNTIACHTTAEEAATKYSTKHVAA